MGEKLHPDALEVTLTEHPSPCLGCSRMLPATCSKAAGIASDAYEPGRTAPRNRPHLLHNNATIAILEGEREHHVADDEPPSRREYSTRFAQCQLLTGIVEMVECVVGDNERHTPVRERKRPKVAEERRDVPDSGLRRMAGESSKHPRRNVDRRHVRNQRGEGESDQPGARTKVEHAIIRCRIRPFTDGVAQGLEGLRRRDRFPRLDAVVPPVGILGRRRRLENGDIGHVVAGVHDHPTLPGAHERAVNPGWEFAGSRASSRLHLRGDGLLADRLGTDVARGRGTACAARSPRPDAGRDCRCDRPSANELWSSVAPVRPSPSRAVDE